jgi:hypothetical protein
MKKMSILFCISLFTMQLVIGQKIDNSISMSSQELHDFYMKKHKTYNIIGGIMLVSGIGMTIGGLATNASSWGESNKNNGLGLFYFGAATTLLSIPVFITAGRSKRKAKLALKGETVNIRHRLPEKSIYPAIALTVKF